MNLPTQHQIVVAGAHIATAGAAVVATLGFTHVLNPAQVNDATQAISSIGDGLAKIMTGLGTLIALASAVYATISSGPFASLFRASAAIAADPAKMAQLKTLTVAEQAPLVAVTDKLPDVAGVGTTTTGTGLELARSVPSNTVQPATKAA